MVMGLKSDVDQGSRLRRSGKDDINLDFILFFLSNSLFLSFLFTFFYVFFSLFL